METVNDLDGPEPPAFDVGLYAEQIPPRPGGPLDTDSPSQREAAERKQVSAAQQRTEVLQAMLSTKAGRDFLAFVLFELCGFTHSTVLPSGAHTFSDFRAGQRDVALKLNQMLRAADKSGYVVLLSEHVDQI
jgi:hypothetical protein